jgi:hypoxanthine phosphoribosyltransferase
MNKIHLDFLTITQRINQIALPPIDHVVGIATGGIVPASLLAYRMACSLSFIKINYRALDNTPQRPAPLILESFQIPQGAKNILLVDDVSVSGQTMRTAQQVLKDFHVISFVLKGQADFVVFTEISTCVSWPWKMEEQLDGSRP